MTIQQVAELREALGGRRFVMTMGCAFINSAMFQFGHLSEQGYLYVLGGTVFAYLAQAVLQKIRAPESQGA